MRRTTVVALVYPRLVRQARMSLSSVVYARVLLAVLGVDLLSLALVPGLTLMTVRGSVVVRVPSLEMLCLMMRLALFFLREWWWR
jgi:hypothetical protein